MSSDRIDQVSLHTVFCRALEGSADCVSDLEVKPLEVDFSSPLPFSARVYLYNATSPPGGRPAGEHKIQLIVPNQARGERGSFDDSGGRTVLLVGYVPVEEVFVLWDAGLYVDFAYSRNVQVKAETVLTAYAVGIGMQERTLRPAQGLTVRETVVAASADHLARAVAMRIDLTRHRLLESE